MRFIQMVQKGFATGIPDSDPMAFILFIYMAFVMIFFLASNSSINPISGNTTITTKLSQGYSNLKWFLFLIAPIGGYIIIKGWNDLSESHDEEVEEE